MSNQRRLLAGQYAVLGLLSLRPMHGYQLARYFDRDDLSLICPLEQSLLYAYLNDLAKRGMVGWEEQRVGARPPRKIFHLTEAGHAALEEWLMRPVERLREVRLDFLLKLYFALGRGTSVTLLLLDAQIKVCHQYLARLEAQAASISPESFDCLVLESKITAAQATIDWLSRYRHTVGQSALPRCRG